MAWVTMPTLTTPGAPRRVNDVDDVPARKRAGRHDEHRLVPALIDNRAAARFELGDRPSA
jgi:hypothetical protein